MNELPRRRWSVAEIREMVAEGFIREDDRFELIDGQVVPMSLKSVRHERVKAALQQHWFPLIVGSPIDLITETTLYASKHDFYEPDFLFWPRSVAIKDITAATSFLIVEVADTSIGYDLGVKAPTYARLRLPEYWVVNARTLVTSIHREPGPSGYAPPREAKPTELIEPLHAPQLAVRLADLDLGEGVCDS
jgi:Uma2 family endonuclease